MQNKDSNRFSKFMKTRGYYMVLGLCVLAVGTAGVWLVSDAVRENRAVTQTMSQPVVAQAPAEQTPEEAAPEQTPPRSGEEETAKQVISVAEQTVMPVSGTVLQDYAMDHLTYNPTTQDWRVHSGVDLAAPLGEPVRAARDGTVTAVYEDACYGVTVVLQHKDGYASRYAGLAAEPAAAVGDRITAGQTLGVIGDTALIEAAQEPHLHFEVSFEGEPVDPAGFLY